MNFFVIAFCILSQTHQSDLFDVADLYFGDLENIRLNEKEEGLFQLEGRVERRTDLKRIQEFLKEHPEVVDKTRLAPEIRPKSLESPGGLEPSVFLELVLVEVKKTAFEKLGVRVNSPISFGMDLKFQFPGEGARLTGGSVDPIRAFLDLAIQKGDARIHAKQSVVTENKKEGEFQVGGEFPIKVVSGYVSRVEFKNFGLILKVLPQLKGQQNVHLQVTSEISEIDMGSLVDGIPVIQKKELKTQLNCRLNEMIAIGGIVRASLSKFSDEIPGLGQIPLLGRLFRSEDFKRQKSEAYIFITPKKMDQPWIPSPDL